MSTNAAEESGDLDYDGRLRSLRRKARASGYAVVRSRSRRLESASYGMFHITDQNRNIIAGESAWTGTA